MIKRNKLRGENFMKIFVNGREVRQTVVAAEVEVLLECVEALKNGGNEKHPPEQIAEIKSSWSILDSASRKRLARNRKRV